MTNAFVFGGCVSRDIRPYLGDGWEMVEYVARQSWISAASGPTVLKGTSALTSNFQNRCLQNDIAGNGFQLIEKHRDDVDILIADLIVERLGVYRNQDNGIITHSWELERSTLLDQQDQPLQHITFGDPDHFQLWQDSAKLLREKIEELQLPTLILAPLWASKADNGGGGFDYRGIPAEQWNRTYEPYYDYVEQLGFNLVRPPSRLSVAKKEHKWGLAAYHYIDKMYVYLANEIQSFSESLS